MSTNFKIDDCVAPIERIQQFRSIMSSQQSDFIELRDLFLTLANSDLLTGDINLQISVADDIREILNNIYENGELHRYTMLLPDGDALSLKVVRDEAKSILYEVTADGTVQEMLTLNTGPFSDLVPPIEFGSLDQIMLFVDEQADKRYTNVSNLLYQLDIKSQMNDVVDTVLDLAIKGETKASDVMSVVSSKFGNLYSSSQSFLNGIMENTSFLDSSTVLPFVQSLLETISTATVSDSGNSIQLSERNYSNKGWLGSVVKEVVTSLATLLAATVAYVVDPILGAIVAGVGYAISFISTKARETASPRIHWNSPLYDYAMSLFTTSVENVSLVSTFPASYKRFGLGLNSLGNMYILTTPVYNKAKALRGTRYQCLLNLAYKPRVDFSAGGSGQGVFQHANSHMVRVSYDGSLNGDVSIQCAGWDATYKDNSTYNHSDYYSPSVLITASRVSDDDVLTTVAAGLSEALSMLTKTSLSGITVKLPLYRWVEKDFSTLTSDRDKAFAWMGLLLTYAYAKDHAIIHTFGSNVLTRSVIDITWSDINDTIIPLIRSMANDLSVPCSTTMINQSFSPTPMDPGQVLNSNGFVEPPVFSKEQWIKTGLLLAAGAAVAAVATVGVIKIKRAITQFRVKRYVTVQNAMQRYASSGSVEDLKAYTKAARKYNFLSKFIGGNKVDLTTGWEVESDSTSSVLSEAKGAFSAMQDRLNDSGDTVSTDAQLLDLASRIKNLISAD